MGGSSTVYGNPIGMATRSYWRIGRSRRADRAATSSEGGEGGGVVWGQGSLEETWPS